MSPTCLVTCSNTLSCYLSELIIHNFLDFCTINYSIHSFTYLFIYLLIDLSVYMIIYQLLNFVSFTVENKNGSVPESGHTSPAHTAAPITLSEIEILIKRTRTLDLIPQNAIRKGSSSNVNSANNTLTSTATAIPYSTFTVRAQKRARIMSDIVRLAQLPKQKKLSSKHNPYYIIHHPSPTAHRLFLSIPDHR